MRSRVLFLGGNGHAPARLNAVQAILDRSFSQVVSLYDVPLAGFAGRARAHSWEDFLDQLEQQVARLGAEQEGTWIYATGVSGLYALSLRQRGRIRKTPLILQGPVLWGLEKRTFPRIMRSLPGAPQLLQKLFTLGFMQRHFVEKHLLHIPSPADQAAFFEGYRQAASFADLFHWLVPSYLRDLEQHFRGDPEGLDHLQFWWGEKDSVVSTEELEVTEQALGRRFPLRRFPEWGHYPMLDRPEDWVQSLVAEVTAESSQPEGESNP